MKSLFVFIFLFSAVQFESVESHPILKLLRVKRNTCPSTEPKKVVCYWGSWSTYRPEEGKFETTNIDPKLCTHIIYTFALPKANGELSIHDEEKVKIKELVALKDQNPDLKIMLAAGGWNAGTEKFSQIAGDRNKRSTFVDSVSDMMNEYDLDGFDMDWEYPNKYGNAPHDKANLNLLLNDLKQRLSADDKLLSIAVGMGKIKQYYDIKGVADNVDFINAMTYDFKGPWESTTGHHTNMDDVEESINTWIDGGAPSEKINLGTAFYGKSYKTQKPSNGAIGVLSKGAGDKGPYTREAGLLGYNEICKKINNGELKLKNDNQNEPVAHNRDTFVAFDTPESVKNKNEWAKKKCLGGGMMWSMDTDDFRGNCGEGKFPLLQAMNDVWMDGETNGDGVPETDSEESEDEPDDEDEYGYEEEGNEDEDEDGEDETPHVGSGSCKHGSRKAYPGDKTKFYWCVHGNWEEYNCSQGTVFIGLPHICGY